MKNTKEFTKVDFKGQVFSVGLDVHKESWKVSIALQGRILKTFSADTKVDALIKTLNKLYPGGNFKFCYEAGFCGFWIQRAFASLNYNCIVINPADIPSTQKETLSKTDTVDAKKLARELEKGSLIAIYIPTKKEESLRDMYRLRASFIKRQTALKNQIKSFLNRYGKDIADEFKEKLWTKSFIQWLKSVDFDFEYSKIAFNKYIAELEHIILEIEYITKKLSDILDKDEDTKITFKVLKSVAGIGKICAMALIAELNNIKRFKNDDHINSYIGLIPTTKNSGEKDFSRGITFRQKKKLRNIIIESSWIAISKDPALLFSFNKLCKRMKKNRAIIRIAKKLVRRIRYVWLNNEEYVYGVLA